MPKRKATAASVVDFNKLTVALLKQECGNRKIDSTGKKSDLIQRLVCITFSFFVDRPHHHELSS